MTDDITLKILQRVADGKLPLTTVEAEEIAPLSRYHELKASNFIEGAVIGRSADSIIKVSISGITHAGRAELDALLANRKASSPITKSLNLFGRIFWMLIGMSVTVLGLWIAKQLGLK